MTKLMISALAFSVASVAVSATAVAETKSWTALKPHVTAKGLVVGIDVDALRSTTLFPAALAQITKEDAGPKSFIDSVKAACSIDVPAAITDITVNFDFEHDTGVIALGLGIDRAKFDECFTAGAKKNKPQATVKIETKGHVTTYSVNSLALSFVWVGKDVVAFKESLFGRPKPGDAAALEAYMTGKPATAMLQASIARANSNKPVWFAASGLDAKTTELIGNVSVDKGTITLMAKLAATDAAAATQLATDAKDKLARGSKKTNIPADALRVIQAVKVGQSGTTVSIDGSISDKDAQAAMQVFDKVF